MQFIIKYQSATGEFFSDTKLLNFLSGANGTHKIADSLGFLDGYEEMYMVHINWKVLLKISGLRIYVWHLWIAICLQGKQDEWELTSNKASHNYLIKLVINEILANNLWFVHYK